jgi:transcriptional regulator
VFSADLKRGSMAMLILAALDGESRHGYEIGKRIEARSGGTLEFKVSTLYSALYRMENKGWIKGRWVEKQGQRRRCYYTLTRAGQEALDAKRRQWAAFTAVVDDVIGVSHA